MSPVINSKILRLPDYEVMEVQCKRPVAVTLAWTKRPRGCPYCGAGRLHSKGRYVRRARHVPCFGLPVQLVIRTHRYRCCGCDRSFTPELPGIRPWRHSSERYRQSLYEDHQAGISASGLAEREQIGAATVGRCYAEFTQRKASERLSLQCPVVLGIDEHTLHKGQRFATTFCDLKNRRVFDVAPGRSPAELEAFVQTLQGRDRVRVVCIDLSSPYRSMIRRWFPKAKIVADRFHVVRVAYHHFLSIIRSIAPRISHHRGFLACLRRPRKRLTPEQHRRLQELLRLHPAIEPLLDLREQLCELLNQKCQTQRQCRRHAKDLFQIIEALRNSKLSALQTLAQTISQWSEEIAAMWRFSKNNGITEGFHRKMKLIQRRAYGFRNFNNYRLRVIAQCG